MARQVDVRNIDTYYFSDTSFNLLMQNRIRRVLVVCSSYDFFMLEEDGRIDEHIFNEYVSLKLENEDLSAIDYVFCWLGNADILLAIIKLIEDRRNADFDIQQVGVQA